MDAHMTSLFVLLTSHLCHDNTNIGPADAHLHLIATKFCLQGQQRINTVCLAQSGEEAQRDAAGKTQRCISKVCGGALRLPQISEMRALLCHVHAAALLAADRRKQFMS